MWRKIRKIVKIILKIIIEFLSDDDGDENSKKKDDSFVNSTQYNVEYRKAETVIFENKKFIGKIKKDYLFACCNRINIDNVVIADSSTSNEAHRDAIQIVPFNNDGYTAGHIDRIKVTNSSIDSVSQLQGIFIGDGSVGSIVLDNIQINTQSAHSITLSGVQSGTIRRCTTSTPIKLLPLRVLGGTNDGRSIWIIQDKKLKYGHVDKDSTSVVDDLRMRERRGWNVYNVDAQHILREYDDSSKDFDSRRQEFLAAAIMEGARVVTMD